MYLNNIGEITNWKTGEHWSSDKIIKHSKNLAFHLNNLKIQNKSKIIIIHDDSPRYISDLLGLWEYGACGVCLNHNITNNELSKIINQVKPEAIISTEKNFNFKLEYDLKIIFSEKISNTDTTKVFSYKNLDDDALILFTSGTTGIPKGVVHTHRSILSRLTLNQLHIPKEDREITLSVLPTYFGHGLIGNILTPLTDSQKVIIAPGNNLDFQSRFPEIIDEYKISFMSSVPSFWKKILLNKSKPKNKSLRRIQVGSAPLSLNLWENIADWSSNKNIFNMYGITETANWISGISLTEKNVLDGSIGRIWGGSFGILNENNQILSSGEGEILVQNPSLMKGYLNLQNDTNNVLKNGWFYTGDIGKLSSDGTAQITGRKRYMINRGGLKVHPEDIDLILEKNNDVEEACTFAIDHQIEGETIGVAISMKDKAKFDEFKLKKWCSKLISREKIPTKWFNVKSIPKTERGKINRDNVAKFCKNLKNEINK